MHRVTPYVLVALTFTACAKEAEEAAAARSDESEKAAATVEVPPPPPDKPSSLATAETTAAASASPDTADQATPLGAVSLPDMAACARRCVVQNQMRAVAAEQIEADCQGSCHAECLEFCKEGQGDRPINFAASCRTDCDKQRDRIKQKR